MENKLSFTILEGLIVRMPVMDESFLDSCTDSNAILDIIEGIQSQIYIASSAVYDLYRNFDELSQEKKHKAILSFFKYIVRASTRPTPYGMFAGVFQAQWNGSSKAQIVNQDFKAHFSVDYRVLEALCQLLLSEKSTSLYALNNTIVFKKEKIKLLNYRRVNGVREHYSSEYRWDEPLEIIINSLKKSSKSLPELQQTLIKNGADFEEVELYLNKLLSSQVIMPEFELCLNNERAFQYLSEAATRLEENDFIRERFEKISEILIVLNKGRIDVDKLITLKNLLSSTIEGSYIKDFFKVDLIGSKTEQQINIDGSIRKTLRSGVELFLRLKLFRENQNIHNFIQTFTSKYQYRAVPIMDLLDPETGIGYPDSMSAYISPLIDDIPMDFATSEQFNQTSFYLYEKVLNIPITQEEVIIKEDELPSEIDYSQIADTFHAMFRIINTEEKTIYIDAIGSNALNATSRFGYGDKKISEMHKEIADFEDSIYSYRNQVSAEISHIPDRLQAANIIDNQDIRKIRIPIICVEADDTINDIVLDDLLVTVRNHSIILYSKSMSKEVIPRFSTMALPGSISSLPVYRFLIDVAIGNHKNFVFSWNNIPATQNLKYIPRLKYKNIIIAPRIWKLYKSDIKDIEDNFFSQEAVTKLRKMLNLPEKIVIKDYDNELLINLKNRFSLEILCEEINKKDVVRVAEYMYSVNSPFNTLQGNPINSQIIAFFKKSIEEKDAFSARKNLVVDTEEDLNVIRTFYPGSEWVYYKIYCEPADSDAILEDISENILQSMILENILKGWFFIRFIDEGYHIRLRFLVADSKFSGEAIMVANQYFSLHPDIRKFSLDTYDREIERYGKEAIILSEKLFYYDSLFAIKLIKERATLSDPNIGWLYALKAVNMLLDQFGLNDIEKLDIINAIKEEFNQEFRVDRNNLRMINDKFRQYTEEINSVMGNGYSLLLEEALRDRNASIREITKELSLISKNLRNLIHSHIHMSLNRYFVERQRKHEMVLYNLLTKYYAGVINKKRLK